MMKEHVCIILAIYFIITVIGEQFLLIQIPNDIIRDIRIADYNVISYQGIQNDYLTMPGPMPGPMLSRMPGPLPGPMLGPMLGQMPGPLPGPIAGPMPEPIAGLMQDPMPRTFPIRVPLSSPFLQPFSHRRMQMPYAKPVIIRVAKLEDELPNHDIQGLVLIPWIHD